MEIWSVTPMAIRTRGFTALGEKVLERPFDSKIPSDPSEESFHLPAALVKLRDGPCRNGDPRKREAVGEKHVADFETDSLATRDSRVDRIRQLSYIFRSVCLVSLEERLVEDGC